MNRATPPLLASTLLPASGGDGVGSPARSVPDAAGGAEPPESTTLHRIPGDFETPAAPEAVAEIHRLTVRNADDRIDADEDVAVVTENSVVRANGEDRIRFIGSGGYSVRHSRAQGSRIEHNAAAGIGCMDDEDTDGDYRAADIPETIELIDNEITGNGRDLNRGTLGAGRTP